MRLNKGIVAFTLIEDAALVVWLTLARAGGHPLALLLLAAGLFLEHIVAYRVKLGRVPGVHQLGQLGVNGVLEALIWGIWLVLWPVYGPFAFGIGLPTLATVWLFATLAIEHSVTDNIMHGQDLFQRVFKPKVLGFTGVEVLAGTLWLTAATNGVAPLGILALLVLQYYEHKLALEAV